MYDVRAIRIHNLMPRALSVPQLPAAGVDFRWNKKEWQ
jgi:hypothetical protein